MALDLGGTIADRGLNDPLGIKIYRMLIDSGVKIEILASNHDCLTLCNLNSPKKMSKINSSLDNYSYIQQCLLLENGTKTEGNPRMEVAEFQKALKDYHIPHLKLVSYLLSPDKQKIMLFMHGCCNLDPIMKLAQSLKVKFKANTALELADTINHINSDFQRLFIENQEKAMAIIDYAAKNSSGPDGLSELIWSEGLYRESEGCESVPDEELMPTFVVKVMHGHVGGYYDDYIGETLGLDLDCRLGKLIQEIGTKSTFKVLTTQERQEIAE